MKNTLPLSMNGIVAAAIAAAYGAEKHGTTISLLHNTATTIGTERTAAVGTRDAHETGKQTLRDRKAALNTARLEARALAMLSRDNLKPILGGEYSEAWDRAGFVGSLAVPSNVEDLLVMTETLGAFFTANPAWEIERRNVTAARADELFTALAQARGAVDEQETEVDNLMAARDEKFDALRKRLRGLIGELEQLLDPLDARWLTFGFNKPGADETPDVPEGVKVTLIGPNAAAIKWDAAARSQYYRVWKKVNGVDAEPVTVGSPADLDFTMENLPSSATVAIAISAVNNGGESQLSQFITITTH